MKKFLAGAMVAVTIICVVYFMVIPKTSNNPINKINKAIDQVTKPEPTEVKPDPVILVKEVQQLDRFETASLTMSRVFNATRDSKRLWGALGEQITFVANGEVIAGIDLSSIDENDFEVIDNTTIKINLPKAEIFSVIIDNNTSYIASRTKGFLANADPKLETEVRSYAQDEFKKTALNSDLLDRAYKNATNNIQSLAEKIGFTTVIFTDQTTS